MQKVAWNKMCGTSSRITLLNCWKQVFRLIDNQKGGERQIIITAVGIHHISYFNISGFFLGCVSSQQKI